MKSKFIDSVVGIIVFLAIIGALVTAALSSCTVSRTVTTSSQYLQRGDTGIVIQTKIIETYDGSKK